MWKFAALKTNRLQGLTKPEKIFNEFGKKGAYPLKIRHYFPN